MPVASEDGQSSDVFFNPFAVDEPLKSSFTPPPIPSGNVALRPKRRRGSGSDTTATSASTGINAVADFRSHTRAHTEAYADIYSSSHPLRSAGVASGSNLESITRPNLARMVEVGILVDAPSIDETYDGESILEAKASSTEEKDVLVHEISSQDSLAGVALKYGISLAELRRANHLWSSDSIHSRTVLYIPLDKTSHSQKSAANLTSPSSPVSENVREADSSSTADVSPTSSGPTSRDTLSVKHSANGTIRRIPASQLSFFPPSTKQSPAKPPDIRRPGPNPTLPYPTKSLHTRYATSPSQSLSNILTALPIAASTRDTIIARLSLESTSSSYSDRDSQGGEDGEGHEMDDVRGRRSRTPRRNRLSEDDIPYEDAFDVSEPTPRLKNRTPATVENTRKGKSSASPPPSPTDPLSWKSVTVGRINGRSRIDNAYASVSSSRFPSESRPSHHIRTVQLEPSPVMQLPMHKPSRATSLGRADGQAKKRGALVDLDFGDE